MNRTIQLILVIGYNLALLGGTIWLVGWHDWSGWWFLLTMIFMASSKD